MLVLTRSEIERVVTMADAIPVVRAAFASYSTGMTTVPVRTAIRAGDDNVVLFMPAHRLDPPGIGVKVVAVYPTNQKRGLPVIHAAIVMYDPATGEPAALLEGGYVTGLRTGAAGGVAADLLARPEAQTVALFGAGVQGWYQLQALRAVRPITRVMVVDVRREVAEEFAARAAGQLGIRAEVTGRPEAAVADADIVVTATTSPHPVFDGSALRPGTHINAIGAFTPETRELDDTTLRRCDRVVVDSLDAAWAEAGELIIPRDAGWFSPDRVEAEIGHIAAGLRPGRRSAQEITLFKTVGIAILDVAMAARILDLARARAVGTEVRLS